jgi:hypothetical protein
MKKQINEFKRMQQLAGIKLNEAYINKQGNLISDAEFVVKQTGFFDLILIDKEKINLNDYINFQSTQSKWSNQKVANSIFNQILELYKGTALEKYNNTVGFIPTKKINRGNNVFDAPSLSLNFIEGIDKVENGVWKEWLLPPLYVETPIDREEYSLEGRTFPGIPGFTNEPITIGPGEKSKIATNQNSEEGDIENKLMYLDITYIPFIYVPKYKEYSYDIETKSNIVDMFNEIGLDAISYTKNK